MMEIILFVAFGISLVALTAMFIQQLVLQTSKRSKLASKPESTRSVDAQSTATVAVSRLVGNSRLPKPANGTHYLSAAPMVDQSDLAFRMLVRRFGADLVFTPMFYSDKFADDAKYRQEAFQTCEGDRPLVVQFSGNDPHVLLSAARHVEASCDAIDLNLGCPVRLLSHGVAHCLDHSKSGVPHLSCWY